MNCGLGGEGMGEALQPLRGKHLSGQLTISDKWSLSPFGGNFRKENSVCIFNCMSYNNVSIYLGFPGGSDSK